MGFKLTSVDVGHLISYIAATVNINDGRSGTGAERRIPIPSTCVCNP